MEVARCGGCASSRGGRRRLRRATGAARRAHAGAAPDVHLDEGKNSARLSHDIDLACSRPEVTLADAITLGLQVLAGQRFTQLAERAPSVVSDHVSAVRPQYAPCVSKTRRGLPTVIVVMSSSLTPASRRAGNTSSGMWL